MDRLRAEHKATAAPALTNEQRAAYRQNNPFKPGPSFNLTAQCRLLRYDSTLAAELQATAG